MKKHEETGILLFENYNEQEEFLKQKENLIMVMPMEGEEHFFPLVITGEKGKLIPMGLVKDGELAEMKKYILRYFREGLEVPSIAVSYVLNEHFV